MKRHSLINQKYFEQKINELFDNLENELNENEKKQIDVCDTDSLLLKIDDLIKGSIGDPPANQDELNKIYEEGKRRYENKIPPGYADIQKEREEEPSFFHGNIVYQRVYGDLVIWKQLLEKSKSSNIKSVTFLTNDVKEDWIWRISGKTIGPRPELRDEIHRFSGVTLFHIYTAEQFLSLSRNYLKVNVSNESLEATKDMVQWLRKPRLINPYAEQQIAYIMPSIVSKLINENETVINTIANTNASRYGIDGLDVKRAQYFQESELIIFQARVRISGTQNKRQLFKGNLIDIDLTGRLKYEENIWTLQRYKIGSCEIVDW